MNTDEAKRKEVQHITWAIIALVSFALVPAALEAVVSFLMRPNVVEIYSREGSIPRIIEREIELPVPEEGHQDWNLQFISQTTAPSYHVKLLNIGKSTLWVISTSSEGDGDVEIKPGGVWASSINPNLVYISVRKGPTSQKLTHLPRIKLAVEFEAPEGAETIPFEGNLRIRAVSPKPAI